MGTSEAKEGSVLPTVQGPVQDLSITAEGIRKLEPGDPSLGDLEIPTALKQCWPRFVPDQDSAICCPGQGFRTCTVQPEANPSAATFQAS